MSACPPAKHGCRRPGDDRRSPSSPGSPASPRIAGGAFRPAPCHRRARRRRRRRRRLLGRGLGRLGAGAGGGALEVRLRRRPGSGISALGRRPPGRLRELRVRRRRPGQPVFLQDLSGSMAIGGRLDASKEALGYFLAAGRPGDEFALASFAGDRRDVDVPSPATAACSPRRWRAGKPTALPRCTTRWPGSPTSASGPPTQARRGPDHRRRRQRQRHPPRGGPGDGRGASCPSTSSGTTRRSLWPRPGDGVTATPTCSTCWRRPPAGTTSRSPARRPPPRRRPPARRPAQAVRPRLPGRGRLRAGIGSCVVEATAGSRGRSAPATTAARRRPGTPPGAASRATEERPYSGSAPAATAAAARSWPGVLSCRFFREPFREATR